MTQMLTDRSDVYSFGVVMLELITGKVPVAKGRYIVRDISATMNSQDRDLCGLTDSIDPYLRNSPALAGFGRFVDLAMRCVEGSAAARPTMSDVVKEIESILRTKGSTRPPLFGLLRHRHQRGERRRRPRPPRHPYGDPVVRKEVSSDSFDYGGVYALLAMVKPK
ncbi:unnamed protein product [Spirodela intermedia]|uniref:Protein kinase domain-containing protein n=1 Tax=Spirodela intermedia TaxID=51605 RepID=A0A7I8IBW7_SPIIN|nr:unnamed protein product [Spirodela intermedia]CAA6654542.1 unnamed protein product [Spirodela intermedia]